MSYSLAWKLAATFWCGLLTATYVSRPKLGPHPVAWPTMNTYAQVVPPTVSLTLFDEARERTVPVTLYFPAANVSAAKSKKKKRKLALLNHGYGGQNTDYSFIAQILVAHGYFVASIQHELPTDEPNANTGNLRETRRPNWERGVQNMLFVRQQLQQRYPGLDEQHLLLVGHSNGGDMAMLFTHEHPQLVKKVISLDNRRMPLPRTRHPRILSIRSSDQVADEGVLPTAAEQKAFGIKIVKLPATIHNDVWDGATAAQKQEIGEAISNFLAR
ncbi:serine aminopeptidase domain-containing protein [Hymenobacter sp. GOD-10R]|uniref:serine aminopeptidase domain-containing protein n=1 Tax=Hymenobacter sp. GOD-10R TaxID=3093922 RepID=UPI002D774AFA|nr:alpha/beta hydrolase [Hymenobacter sp. GOD-10R]WRQ26970.1 alpha/beta hydrolase [Hymenobacter sp. GOD-10R]